VRATRLTACPQEEAAVAGTSDFFDSEFGPPPGAVGGRKSESIADFGNWSPAALPRGPAEPAATWARGDRVLALWEADWFYPGTVGDLDGPSLFVFFDDGGRGWIPVSAVRPLDIGPGSQVFCRFRAGQLFYPATVENRNGDQLFLRYDQGGKEWTVVAHIRVPATAAVAWAGPADRQRLADGAERGGFDNADPRQDDGQEPWPRPRTWSVGERVLAPTGDGWLYPGAVADNRRGEVLVWFDNGHKRWLDCAEVEPMHLGVGSRVFCRWMNGAVYYGGTIKEQNGEQVYIHYDDGDKEWNVLALCRVPGTTSAAFWGNVQSFLQGRYGCVVILVAIIGIGVLVAMLSR
jgi:hypothetical protein